MTPSTFYIVPRTPVVLAFLLVAVLFFVLFIFEEPNPMQPSALQIIYLYTTIAGLAAAVLGVYV